MIDSSYGQRAADALHRGEVVEVADGFTLELVDKERVRVSYAGSSSVYTWAQLDQQLEAAV